MVLFKVMGVYWMWGVRMGGSLWIVPCVGDRRAVIGWGRGPRDGVGVGDVPGGESQRLVCSLWYRRLRPVG